MVTDAPTCGLSRADKVTEWKRARENVTAAPAESGAVAEIERGESRSVGDQPVDCCALGFKVLGFGILYRI